MPKPSLIAGGSLSGFPFHGSCGCGDGSLVAWTLGVSRVRVPVTAMDSFESHSVPRIRIEARLTLVLDVEVLDLHARLLSWRVRLVGREHGVVVGDM